MKTLLNELSNAGIALIEPGLFQINSFSFDYVGEKLEFSTL